MGILSIFYTVYEVKAKVASKSKTLDLKCIPSIPPCTALDGYYFHWNTIIHGKDCNPVGTTRYHGGSTYITITAGYPALRLSIEN